MTSKPRKNNRWKLVCALLILSTLGTITAHSFGFEVLNGIGDKLGLASPSPTPQAKNLKPKRKRLTSRRTSAQSSENLTGAPESLVDLPLAQTDFNLIGLVGTAGPATQAVPKNIPTAIVTSIQVPDDIDPATIIPSLNPNYRIRGELVGPSFTSPRMVEAPIGQPILIPALPNVGDHVVQNLRVVDVTDATGATIAPVVPDSCGITVIERVLITQVQVNEMTYEQIVQSGINIDSSNYNFFNFVLGLATTSGVVPIQIPVAMPSVGGLPPVVGAPQGGVDVSGVAIPNVVPVMLEADPDGDGETSPVTMPGGGQMQIPGVVVFPGRIGLLHQFFEAIVIVANGAPNGTPLVITNLKAKSILPDAGTPDNTADDPLKIAVTQQGGAVSELDIHGLGPDGRYGTADDTTSFSPGQTGQASFLLEGLKEGLHTVDFKLTGVLQGLPIGPVNIVGTVPGAVLVRDARFGVTFTHPGTVRAGQAYDLGVTIFNSGDRNINGVTVNLGSDSVSGATLIDTPQKTISQTIPRGGSATVKWRLRANITGAVTASYVKVGDGVEAGLNLVTGVGDRNVPLSPESLILPDAVRHLPPDVVEASRQMLGQAWSVANAPPGTLPDNVIPIEKQTVVNKAVEVGWAGLRMDFKENRDTTLRTLLRDWLGEHQTNSSTGFADALRNTPAGYYFFDVVGTNFYDTIGAETPTDFHQKLVTTESARSAFVSALVTQNSGSPVFGAKLIAPNGQSVGSGATAAERFGDLRTGASLNLLESDPHDAVNNSKGNLIVVSKPAAGNWSLELFGRADGSADVSILAPSAGRNYRQMLFPNVTFTNGKRYRITFKNAGTNAPVVEEYVNGSYQTVNLAFTSSEILEPSPQVVGAAQVTQDVIEGGDKFGRLVGVLFSKPMTKTSVETINRYGIGGGELASDPSQVIGKLIKTTGATQNFGGRFVILALDSPVGPYIKRNLTVNGVADTSGKTIIGSTIDIEPRVSPLGVPPGGYLTGRVMNADGTPVPNAQVYYRTDKTNRRQGETCSQDAEFVTIANKKTDSNGEFEFDYVREGECFPVNLLAVNLATNSTKSLMTNIAYNGQHLTLNAVFLARGNIQGTVTNAGVPIINASVSIIPELDVLNSKLVRTDSQGKYSATGVPVGGVTVRAVGDGLYSLASGIASGNIMQAGQTITVNVGTQDITGVIKGKVKDAGAGQLPVPNSLVVAFADIPGFPRPDGALTPVGYAFTSQDGSFTIQNLPIGNISLRATDPQRGVETSTTVQLTPQNKEVTGVIMLVSNGFGRVLGRVLNEIGQPIPNASVQEGNQLVRADSNGNYILPGIREGNVNISATDPVTRQTGNTTVSVRRNEDTSGADIIIRRPANLNGQVFISENGVTQPLAQVIVTVDGRTLAQTDAQGRYTLNSVPSGGTTIRFVYPQRRQFVNTDVFLNPGETLTRNATFRPAKIHGRITQPDGVTPVIATVNLVPLLPDLTAGPPFGFPLADAVLSVQTNQNGQYSFDNLNPGSYRIYSSNVFFPIPVSQSGNLPPNADLEINLSLVDTLAGKVHGHIYQPDGVTPVGAGIKVSLGGGSLADVTVRTNESGYYEFAEVFAEGGYTLSATDQATGRTNQTGANIRKNEDITVDLRLLGRGTLKVRAVDAANNPLPGGVVRVEGANYPRDQRAVELTPVNNGQFEFTGLTEGGYAISALYNGLGGRVAANVTVDGVTEVTVMVQPVGSITGRVVMPDGTTPVGLADVTLMQNGRTIGFITTSDSEEERGKFVFQGVPSGDFTLDVLDNRTGRRGRSAGQVTQQGQVVTIDVRLLALGTVVGQVTANGVAASHALVTLSADGSGIASTSRVATTDEDGRFRFPGIPVGRVTVSVTNGPGGLTGQSSGNVVGVIEPLPETVVNVALTPTATVIGTIYKFGGTETFTGALVNIRAGNYVVNTVSDEQGKYRVNFVPLGNIEVRVESPFGYDRGKSAIIPSSQPGATVTANVTMTGVGSISGVAHDSNGVPLSFGRVEFTNNAWGENISVIAPVQPNGSYSMSGLPTGDFNLKLTVSDRIGVGTATGSLTGNQTLNINLQLESAGKIFGVLKAPGGATPAVGADVNLSLARQGGGGYFFVTHTNANGNWEFNNLPLGTINISFVDPNSSGIARLTNLALTTNGQELDTGTVVLDNTPVAVESVTPPDDATNVATNSTVQIVFSEPVDATTVNSGTIRINRGSTGIGISVSIAADEKTVTLTPSPKLAETAVHTVIVSTQVKDKNGNSLAAEFRSDFTTKDETPPTVTAVSPATGSVEIALNSHVIITASEALDAGQNFNEAVQVKAGETPVSANITLDQTGKIINFAPTANLAESTNYTVTVSGLKDLAGNVQTQAFNSTFVTKDLTAPVVDPLPINGQTVRTFTPNITATYHDNASGIKTSSVVLTLDGGNVTSSAVVTGNNLSFTPTAPLSAGNHTVTVQVSDNAGNASAIQTATFTIDNSGPIVSSFTIGGIPVANGVQISTSLNPIFEINYTDDTGINAAATKLRLGLQGATQAEVPITVTNTKLTYQSPTPMTEGVYTVEAIITNNLGTSTTTGVLTFTLDVDAPEIQTITPNTGNQHGGTTVVLSGLRLLNTNNSAPAVTVGGAIATVTGATTGTPDQVTIVTPAGVPGAATIQVTTDRGIGRAINGFNYEADPRTPFAVEPDTRLLWHIDETTSGSGVTISDASPLGNNGTTGGNLLAVPGRFASGRTSSASSQYIQSTNPGGALNLGASGFTLESWFKTPQVGTQRPVMQLYNDFYGELGVLNLETSGALTARLWSLSGIQWNITMPANAYDVDNNQWHYLAFVLDKTENKLKIYVDGELRAESAKPANWDILRDRSDYPTRLYTYTHQNWILDEVRASATAHTQSQILNTYLGAEGNLQTVIYGVNSDLVYPRGTINDLKLTGYNLAGVSAAATDSAGNPVPIQVTSSSAAEVNLRISVASNAALGNAQITLTSSTNSVSTAFRITDLTRIAPGVDVDTVLLWHLDETGNGGITAIDSGPLGIHGSGTGNTIAAQGRFAGGRSASSGGQYVFSPNTFGALNFANSGFTVESWFKAPQSNSQRHLLYLYNDWFGDVGTLSLEATGALTVRLWALNGAQWNVTIPSSVYDVDNNQWHHIAWVLDETEDKLKIYIDGELRSESAKPAGWDILRDRDFNYPTKLYAYLHQNFTQDEVRASSSPHSAQTIRQDFLGESQMRVSSYSYPEIVRNRSTVTAQEFTLNGYNLENINAQVVKNGQPINVGVSLISSSFREAKLNLSVQPDTPLGAAQLVITKENQPTATVNLQILEKNPLVADRDTVLLWHLDETGSGGITAIDSGALGIHGSGTGNTIAAQGRFAGGRSASSGGQYVFSQNPFGAMNFGAGDFTVESWVKTPQSNSQRRVMQLYNDWFGEVGSMTLEANGALSANVWSLNNTFWSVAVNRSYNPQTGYSQQRLDDNNWHHVALILNRTENKLKIYVDGELRAESAKPANFDVLRDRDVNYPTKLYSYVHNNFTQDEVRVSSTALTTERIAQSYYGLDQFRLYRTYPLILQRDTTTPVYITGYGLNDVTVTTSRSDVTATITAASLSQLEIAVTPVSTSELGNVQIILTKPSGESLTTQLSVVDQRPYVPALDTVLLWHLDETGSGGITAIDSGALGIHGTGTGNTIAAPGRFAGGRSASSGGQYVFTQNPYGAMNFGAGDFTVESWVKSPQSNSQRRIMQLYNDWFGEVGSMTLEANGALSANVWSLNNTFWSVAVSRSYNPQTGFWQGRIDDDYWHHVALVLDRTENKLKIYVDGELRAESAKPANFDVLRDRDVNYPTKLYSYVHNSFTQDEVRVSSTALSAERISQSYYGLDQFRLYRTYPSIVQRGTMTPVFISGYGLNDVTVSPNRGDVSVNIVSASLSQLQLAVEPIPTADVGDVQITLMKPSGESLNTKVTVVNQQPFANAETGTVLLWHLNETGNGGITAIDSGGSGLHGTSTGNTLAATGRFAGARSASSFGQYVFTQNPFGAMNFGAGSFTFESWIKTSQNGSQRRIMQFYNDWFGEVGSMTFEPNGVLSAMLWSSNNVQWTVATSRSYNPQTGFWQGKIDDEYWHHIVLVLDRTEDKLKIFVDGELQAQTARPSNFDVLRDRDLNYPNKFFAYMHPSFIQDEVRVSNYPRSATQIQGTWFGNNSQPLSLNLPFRRLPEKALSFRRQSVLPDKLTVKKAETFNQSPPTETPPAAEDALRQFKR